MNPLQQRKTVTEQGAGHVTTHGWDPAAYELLPELALACPAGHTSAWRLSEIQRCGGWLQKPRPGGGVLHVHDRH